MKVYAVNGFPGSGKTTFEEMVIKELGADRCFCVSTIDYVKEVAKFCGWDGTKTQENRAFLSELKDLLRRWNDVPFKKVNEKLKEIQARCPNAVVFVDSREPEELARYKKNGAQTLFVKRIWHEDVTSNSSDRNVEKFDYDILIYNNGTLTDLQETVKEFIESEKLRPD